MNATNQPGDLQAKTKGTHSMKPHQTLLLFFNLAFASVFAASAAPVSTSFTYQGRLDNGGVPVNTPQDFRITLYPQVNGGTPVGNPSVNQFVCWPVVNGLFTLTLNFGDSSSYHCEARWLEIAVRPCGVTNPFQVMTQRVELLPTPYAIQSLSACSVESNGVSAVSIQNSTITAAKIATGEVVKSFNGLHDNVNLVAGANITLTPLTPNGNGYTINSSGNGAFSLNGNNAYYNAGNVGIGTAVPTSKLDIGANSDLFSGLGIDDLYGLTPCFGCPARDLASSYYLRARNAFRVFPNGVGYSTKFIVRGDGNVGIGTDSPASKLHVDLNSATFTGVGIDDSYGQLRSGGLDNSYYFRTRSKSFAAPFDYLTQFIVRGDGRVGIGTENPKTALHVNGDYYGRGHLWLHAYEGDGNTGTAYIQARDTSGTSTIELQFRTQVAGNNFDTMRLVAGNVGIGTATPGAKLHVSQSGGVGVFSGDLSPFGFAEFESNASAPTTHAWFAENGNRVFSVTAGGEGFYARNLSVCSLTIRGGCDLAEPFQMSDSEIPKGSLVIIDEEHEGKLKLAGRAYDTRVAGIVSGANGVNPGISLHQEGVIEGGQNVALSGRVYVLADAYNGSIKPGDLLTSSSTPGHVMKVTDHAKAQGAIVGKAMTSLKEGQGMVLVLVSLQ